MSLGIVVSSRPAAAGAEAVDSELMLLVDVSSSGLRPAEFDQVMESYASAMTSAQVLDAIESGAVGKIAVSMIFYGNDTLQEVGIPWMTIGSAAAAAQFAAAARAAVRPVSGTSSIASALGAATAAFGTETGGADNGFASIVQIVEVAGATEPRGGNPALLEAQLQAARDAALAAGVDMINALAVGKRASDLESYYAANVIGGEAGGVAATSGSSAVDAGLASTMTAHLNGGIEGGAAASVAAIPESKVALALLFSVGILVLRSRVRGASDIPPTPAVR